MRRLFFLILLIAVVFPLFERESRGNDFMDTGMTYFARGDFRKAINSFEVFVRLHPDSAEGYEWLGKSYHGLGDNEFAADPQLLEKAAEAFRKALLLNPNFSRARFDLGVTYLCLNNRNDAMKEYEFLRNSDKELAALLHERIRGHSSPPVYRAVHEKGSPVTRVAIIGNQVLVPVILAKEDTEVQATLLLDTGASVTSIHSDVAARLRINMAGTKKTTGQVAGGGMLEVRRTKLSSITVGPHTKTDMDIAIMEHKGLPVRYDGLLGMNFLRNLRYTIDFQNRTINWEP